MIKTNESEVMKMDWIKQNIKKITVISLPLLIIVSFFIIKEIASKCEESKKNLN